MVNEKSKFIKVRCPKCKKEQVIFGKATTKVTCNECNEELTKAAGGKAKIKARIVEILN